MDKFNIPKNYRILRIGEKFPILVLSKKRDSSQPTWYANNFPPNTLSRLNHQTWRDFLCIVPRDPTNTDY